MISDFKTILFKEDQNIGYVTLNRPHKLNAFNQQMLKDLLSIFDYIDNSDSIRAVILSASGKAFCAGADLSAGKDTFNSEFHAYFTFFDITSNKSCYESGTYPCGNQGQTFNGTLGWLMGFRLPLQPIFTGGNTPQGLLNLYGTKV